MYCRVPHWVVEICLSLALTSIMAEYPSRTLPMTRVRRRISFMIRSRPLFVRNRQLEKQVDEYRKRILDDELTEKFGPCDEESFFSYVLKRKLDTRTTVSELIESTKSRQALINAVKELKPLGIAFSPEEKEQLRIEILRRQEQELEKLW